MATDARRPNGVPIQVHAYVSPPAAGASADNSFLRVKEGKTVEIGAANGDNASLRVDHVFQQGTESELMERSLQPFAKACVEGVNVAVLVLGSGKSSKRDVLFRTIERQSLAAAFFQAILTSLSDKAKSLNKQQSEVNANAGKQPFSFTLHLSFMELYDETITDLLLAAPSSDKQPLLVEDNLRVGRTVKNLSRIGPITSTDAFGQLLDAGMRARRTTTGRYGPISEFTSAILQISVRQLFWFPDASTQELISTCSLVELPATDRLARPGDIVRLSEGPLLNKALYAFADAVTDLSIAGSSSSEAGSSRREPPVSGRWVDGGKLARFGESHLTDLIQDALGGNTLTFALLCLAPNDLLGSKATIQLGYRLQAIQNFPVVNNDMMQGLRCRYFGEIAYWKMAANTSAASNAPTGDAGLDYERKIHDLEGRVAHETLEKRLLKEDKDKLVAILNELKEKYQALFDSEIEIRRELLSCEQEKLSLSKAFVEFQRDRNEELQTLDEAKFELETKLIQTEQMVLEIQNDDNKKGTQIQDLCAKMNELISEKQTISEDRAKLQEHARTLELELQREAKKNQQLSLELIVLVNQKQQFERSMEIVNASRKEVHSQLEQSEALITRLRQENDSFRQQNGDLEKQVERSRKDAVRFELELERLQLNTRQIEMEKSRETVDATQTYRNQVDQLTLQLETQRLEAANTQKTLVFQQERLELELSRCQREKDDLVHAWMSKTRENEELLGTNQRLLHEHESQIDAFRAKLSQLSSSGVLIERMAIRELITSYQDRERQLRDQVASFEARLRRLAHHLPQTLSSSSDTKQAAEADRSAMEVDCDDLHERFESSERELVLAMERQAALAVEHSELQVQHERLTVEYQSMKRDWERNREEDSETVRCIKQIHEMLLAQVKEVRNLTIQQQQQTPNPTPRNGGLLLKPASISSASSNSSEDLQGENKRLQTQLDVNKQQWTQSMHQVEKRCAELLTKNAMLDEENQHLKRELMPFLKRHQKTR